MHDLRQMRIDAGEIFAAALRAIDARAAIQLAITAHGERLTICEREIILAGRKIYSIAIGKAALPMAIAFADVVGDRFAGGVIAGVLSEIALSTRKVSSRWRQVEGGHPLPTKSSLEAAAEVFNLLERAEAERALIVFLISGGGSAMIEWPISDQISLADLRTANKALVHCGASISEINAVRRAFSAVKGGRLAARAPNCDQITLIISDVPKDEEYNVASGPTLRPDLNTGGAREVIDRYQLRSQLPAPILHAIDSSREFLADSHLLRDHFVLLSNADAVRGAANAALQRGYVVDIAGDISDQPIGPGCAELANRIRSCQPGNSPVCLISGGEFACPVKGEGTGGRNLESALRLAVLMSQSNRGDQFVALCAGTDGIDGNSPAAGAMVDSTTLERARTVGLSAESSLARSDSYSFFAALDDAIITGPTGTNVRDLRILLAI
jgi:glycerate 2-kinase